MVRKWVDPLDRLLEGDKKAQSVTNFINGNKVFDDDEHTIYSDSKNYEKIIEVTVDKIIRWKYKNRPENELHDIDLLADKMKIQGQQEACIVRKLVDKPGYYELITGERRWRAAIKAQLTLKVVVRELTDLQAAITQKEENDKDPVSEYADGICYAKQIENGVLRQVDLVDKLGLSKQQVSRLLSYSKIPADIIEAIGDMQKVSSGTAEKIKQLCSKGPEYKKAIVELSSRISSGKLGYNRLEKIVLSKINNIEMKEGLKKIYSNDGRLIFTWRLDTNKKLSIHFPNDILKFIEKKIFSDKSLSEGILEVILNEIRNFE